MCILSIPEARVCNKQNALPEHILTSILNVYEFGRKEDIEKLPNNLICMSNGDFWTTWDRVIEIRETLKKDEK